MEDIELTLNDAQRESVNTTEGALLILAGAGTGKTSVLTSRICYILANNLATFGEVLALTFTNKAAKEMKQRMEAKLGYMTDGLWIGTFHSMALRILKRHVQEVGLTAHFTVMDQSDSVDLIKQILSEQNIDSKQASPLFILNSISALKDRNIKHDSVDSEHNIKIGSSNLVSIYQRYQQRLLELNAVDFGDIILHCLSIFAQVPDILELWQKRFKYILVDEYQDTNHAQYEFTRLLSMGYNNICCVGDDDQSIYSWRGADISNILQFKERFLDAKILRLEQNYRSTNNILKAAGSLIARNEHRHGKTLWSNQGAGDKIKIIEAFSGRSEADYIADAINKAVLKNYNYGNIAVLVRASYQTREIEERFLIHGIPYQIIGGSRFYDRLEIKNVIAYLRLLNYVQDDISFSRIINVPKRGIGATSLQRIRSYASDKNISMFDAAEYMSSNGLLSTSVSRSLKTFVVMIYEALDSLNSLRVSDTAKAITERSGYMKFLLDEKTEEARSRVENIKELYRSLDNFNSLEEFLEYAALSAQIDENHMGNKVSIMTLHSSKGLEFDIVFLPGCEEGIFPTSRAVEEGEIGIQEERRLAYVGITRAKKEFYMLYAKNRYMYGNWQSSTPSRFTTEIDKSLVEYFVMADHTTRESRFNGNKEGFSKVGKFNNLLNSSKKFSPNHALLVGQSVSHSAMGIGTVVQVQGPIISVEFANGVQRKIMSNFLSKL